MSDLPPPPPPPVGKRCPNCAAPARLDQDWCLSCGTALTTSIEGAGGWRTPLAIVAAVLLVAAGALVIAFLELSGEADKVARAPVTGPTGVLTATPSPTASPTPTTSPTPAPTKTGSLTGATGPTGTINGGTGPTGALPTATPTVSGGVGSWPKGKTAFTVILFSETSRSSAEAKAKTISGLPKVGILKSDNFSSLAKGFYVVFSGQYGTNEGAQNAADTARSQAPGAYVKEVVPR